ncbi:hypothetical protein L1785_03675 [Antribacter sp. KLBMP9083]|uniref:Uncharacterized protein n=1 Tax=Antribacter soli TaxID=2910976 RepID=A0AA41QDC3_9MICO|nr:hypothetical protein [Antribacter soli]MCF4120069.1 hypothetical protein [Antribacter soli]
MASPQDGEAFRVDASTDESMEDGTWGRVFFLDDVTDSDLAVDAVRVALDEGGAPAGAYIAVCRHTVDDEVERLGRIEIEF